MTCGPLQGVCYIFHEPVSADEKLVKITIDDKVYLASEKYKLTEKKDPKTGDIVQKTFEFEYLMPEK